MFVFPFVIFKTSRWPWLFLITLFGLGVNVIDMILKVFFADVQRTKLDYAWIVLIFLCDLAPLFAYVCMCVCCVLCVRMCVCAC